MRGEAAAAAAARLAPGLVRLTLPLPFGPRHVHCYLLDDGDGFTLVDAGAATPEAARALDAGLAAAGVPPAAVRRVILTHYHVDHSGQAYRLAEHGAEVALHEADVPLLESLGDSTGLRLGRLLRLLERLGMPEADRDTAAEGVRSLRRLARPVPVTRRLRGGDRIEAGGRVWTIVPTPGHTPGHVGLLDGEGLLISGDLLIGHAPPYVPLLPDGDPDPVASALASLGRLAGACLRRCLPGHGEPIDAAARAAVRAAAALRAACDETAARLAVEPESPHALLVGREARPGSPFHRQAALLPLAARLAHLAAEGRAEAVIVGGTLRYRTAGGR